MASDIDDKEHDEDLRQVFHETLGSYTKTRAQLRAQKTMTVLVGVGALVLGAAAGYVAGVLRVGR